MKMFFGAAAASAMLFAAGCESLLTGGPLLREGEPTGIIRVVNQSSHTVDAVLISDCDASTYGLNRMGDGEKIYRANRAISPSRPAAGMWMRARSPASKRASA